MYGFRMCHTEEDQLDLWFRLRAAMDHRAPVRVTFFKQRKHDSGALKGKPVEDRFGNPVYVKVTRVVEPFEFDITRDGHRIVRVVDRSPEGEWGPEYRTIRMDRIAFGFNRHRPVLTIMRAHYMCPSRLDGIDLHPRKTPPKDYPPGDVPAWYVAA